MVHGNEQERTKINKKRLPVIGEDVKQNEKKKKFERIESMSFELIEIMNDPFGRFRSARSKKKKRGITPFPARRKFHICSVAIDCEFSVS